MFDANNDGKISKEEFDKARRERFAMRDLDCDGVIGLDDMGPGMRERVREWRERSRERQDGKEASGNGPRKRARPTSPTRASAARSISSA